ncbi:lipase secretion chaperone [Marinobacter algicola]|uniref:Lipase chaperone n=1 Tax=Marinobacter algicola DG893 TaxID=443152 RepID=A6F5I8_9GAMM|nr:lipase secretion chaperone [Marinobacter algicola]EDM45981.1 Lipase chaperone [Marinobacter algicola DG893]
MNNSDRLNKKALLPLIMTVPVVIACVWFLLADEPRGKKTTTQETSTPATTSEQPKPGIAEAPPANGEDAPVPYQTPDSLGDQPFANSLAGTNIDGNLRADANGELIIDLETRDFFDYFLNTIGEVSAEQALDQIETLAKQSLPENAAREAMTLLNQYLEYKDASLALGNQGLDPARQHDPAYQLDMLKGALADMKQLRRRMFAADTHEAFFGLEEAYGDYTLASLEIQQRTDLSTDAKNTLVEWHRQQLPEVIRRTETRMIEESGDLRARQKALSEADSPADAGRRLRELGVDDAQAREVVAYMKEREQFDSHYQQFQQALASLDNSGLAEEDRATQENRLLKRHFDTEQTRTWARLRALESQSP